MQIFPHGSIAETPAWVRATAAGTILIGSLPLAACGNDEKPTTCYQFQLGALGENVQPAGINLLREYVGVRGNLEDGRFTGLRDASQNILGELENQRAKQHSKVVGPLASDIVGLCISFDNAANHNKGGKIIAGPGTQAVDEAIQTPKHFAGKHEVYVYDLKSQSLTPAKPKG